MAAITAAGLVAAYPQWAAVNTGQPAVVANVVLQANSLTLELYTNDQQDTERRYTEANALLFEHPYARDMLQVAPDTPNHWRREAQRRDRLLGAAYRGPGWELPTGVT